MTYSLTFVKNILEKHLDESKNKVISFYSIQLYLESLKQEFKIEEHINTSILLESSIRASDNTSFKTAFHRVDYQYNFLYHLAKYNLPGKSLVDLIDSFIATYRGQFKLSDVIITKSGATRCITNIRFALNDLRHLGLVLSRNKDNKRIQTPSILGLVALLNIKLCTAEFRNKAYYKAFNSLPLKENIPRLPDYYTYDPILIDSIQMFQTQPEYIYRYLHLQHDNALSNEEKKILEQIINQYIDFVQEELEITEEGIKRKKDFNKKSAEYQEKLLSIEQGNEELHSKLFNHFRKTP